MNILYYDHSGKRIKPSGWRDANDVLRPYSLLGQLTNEEMVELGVTKEIIIEEEPVQNEPDLSLLKQIKWESIKQERERRTQTGGYKVGAKWFHSDTFSRTQQMGLVILGANIPQGLQWKTMDGSFITMTPTLAQQIFGAGAMQDTLTFAVAEQHRTAIQAMQTKEELDVYDIYVGWPEIFNIVDE